mgnify:FL=1|jgi:uncharacterized paraquat-inducible protein A
MNCPKCIDSKMDVTRVAEEEYEGECPRCGYLIN